jgi:hypothetical protein
MEASEIIGVPMLDHIIISSSTNRDSLSFLDKGLL